MIYVDLFFPGSGEESIIAQLEFHELDKQDPAGQHLCVFRYGPNESVKCVAAHLPQKKVNEILASASNECATRVELTQSIPCSSPPQHLSKPKQPVEPERLQEPAPFCPKSAPPLPSFLRSGLPLGIALALIMVGIPFHHKGALSSLTFSLLTTASLAIGGGVSAWGIWVVRQKRAHLIKEYEDCQKQEENTYKSELKQYQKNQNELKAYESKLEKYKSEFRKYEENIYKWKTQKAQELFREKSDRLIEQLAKRKDRIGWRMFFYKNAASSTK